MAHKVVTVSVPEFAELVGKTRQCIYQWIQKGLPHRKEKGVTKIVPREGVRWVIEFETWEFQQQRKAKGADDVDEELEKALTARAIRQLREHELLEKTKQVVPVADLNEFVERVFGTFSAVASGRLQRFEREIVRVKTPAEARKLTDKLHTALMDGARSYADQLDEEAAEIERAALLAAPKPVPATDDGD